MFIDILKRLIGPAVGMAVDLLLLKQGVDATVAHMTFVVLWMAIWWITEVVPIAITSMLPVLLFPLFGIMSTADVAPQYMHHVLWLFIGGFMVAFAMEKWNLHRRIALRIILMTGSNISGVLLGMMLASWFLSMWMSNTATTMMMLPTAIAVLTQLNKSCSAHAKKLAIGLLLGIAYSASIGGIATLIGTPPNLIFLSQFQTLFPDQQAPTFLAWFLRMLPLSILMLGAAYFLIKYMYFSGVVLPKEEFQLFRNEYKNLGGMKYEEKWVSFLFSLMALLWFTRAPLDLNFIKLPGWSELFAHPEYFKDGTVAVLIATLFFLIPSKEGKGKRLLHWEDVKKLPLEVILLFGGGFALAAGFQESGLSEWLAGQISFVSEVPVFVSILVVCFCLTFLTEMTSNMATTQLFLPLLAAIAVGAGISPELLMIPATISASFAFMLPVATAPNTIIFASGHLQIKDMAKTGIYLNLTGVLITTIYMLLTS
ncbi:MAG: SLC13 family permease [Chitinophagales bacterium]